MKWFNYETNDPVSFAVATDVLRRLGYNTEVLEKIPNEVICKTVTISVTNFDPESTGIFYNQSTGIPLKDVYRRLDEFIIAVRSNALDTSIALNRAIYRLNNSFSRSELKALLNRVPELKSIIDETKIL